MSHPIERPIHLRYEKYGASHRQWQDEEDSEDCHVSWAVYPKLINVAMSEDRRTTGNGRGTAVPAATISHLVCNSASARSNARDWSHRCESSRGVRRRTFPRALGLLTPIPTDPDGRTAKSGPNHVDPASYPMLQVLSKRA